MTALSLFNFDTCIKKIKKFVYKSIFLVYNYNVKRKKELRMTVKELIEKLKQFDENNDVVIDESCLSDNLDDVHDVTLQQSTVIDKDGNETSIDEVVIY